MSGDVVNLRQMRKRKARVARETEAAQNRVSFGRTRAEKNLTGALNDQARRRIEDGRLEPVDGGDTDPDRNA